MAKKQSAFEQMSALKGGPVAATSGKGSKKDTTPTETVPGLEQVAVMGGKYLVWPYVKHTDELNPKGERRYDRIPGTDFPNVAGCIVGKGPAFDGRGSLGGRNSTVYLTFNPQSACNPPVDILGVEFVKAFERAVASMLSAAKGGKGIASKAASK